MIKGLFFGSILLFLVLILSPPAAAINSSLKQRIVPLNCIYQIVNDGTGTIIYLTPEECGVLPETPPDPEAPPDPQAPEKPPIVVTITDTGTQVIQVPLVPVPNSSTDSPIVEGTQYLPFQPIAEVTSADATQTETATVLGAIPIPVAVAGIAALILLILLFIL